MREVIRAVVGPATRLRFDRCVGRWLGTIDFRRSRAATSTTDILLSLGAVVSSVRFDSLMGTCGMVASEVLELIGLGVGDFGGVLDVVINELLVGHVDQGTHVDAGDCDEGQAPEWNDLDEPVGEKSCDEAGNGVHNIFGKEDTLELDDEEVDELLNILQ